MIKNIQILGERCSGTNFVSSLVKKNLENIQLTKDFGGKHWFLKDHYPRSRPNETTDAQCVRSINQNSSDTLFICIVRNPYDWVRSMHARPHHAYNHSGIALFPFLSKPWLSFEKTRINRFWPHRTDNYWFIEEAPNILKLRSMKMEHWLNLRHKVENIYFLNYEKILKNNEVLADIAKNFDLKLGHSTILGEQRYMGRAPGVEFKSQKYPEISEENLEFIRSELNWDLEAELQYAPRDYQP